MFLAPNTPGFSDRLPAPPAEASGGLYAVVTDPIGDVARGGLGLESATDEAVATLYNAARFIVPVAPHGPKTCMEDGQAGGVLSSGTETTERVEPRAKMPGGSAAADYFGDEYTRFLRALRGALKPSDELPNPLGRFRAIQRERVDAGGSRRHASAHVRMSGTEPGESGCGMIDEFPAANERIIEEAEREEGDRLAAITDRFMRIDFNPAVHAGVVEDARRLSGEIVADGWSGTEFIDIILDPEKTLDLSEGGESPFGDSIEVTVGDHAPALLVFNYGDGTLDRDEFVAQTGQKVLWIDEPAIWEEAQNEATDPANYNEVCERYQAMMTVFMAGALTLAGPQLRIGLIGYPQPAILEASLRGPR